MNIIKKARRLAGNDKLNRGKKSRKFRLFVISVLRDITGMRLSSFRWMLGKGD